MTVAKLARLTVPDRVTALERRADDHDKIIPPMANQVTEMYELLTKWRNINWFFVKVGAAVGAALGGLTVILTIAEKLAQLFGHH